VGEDALFAIRTVAVEAQSLRAVQVGVACDGGQMRGARGLGDCLAAAGEDARSSAPQAAWNATVPLSFTDGT
jgi:hypothetical protein